MNLSEWSNGRLWARDVYIFFMCGLAIDEGGVVGLGWRCRPEKATKGR